MIDRSVVKMGKVRGNGSERSAESEIKYKARRQRGNEFAKLKRLKDPFAGTGMVKLGDFKVEQIGTKGKKTGRNIEKGMSGASNQNVEKGMSGASNQNIEKRMSGASNVNIERIKRLENVLQTIERASEAAEMATTETAATELPDSQHGRTRKTWKERIAERTSDWESSKEEFFKSFLTSHAYVQNVCCHCSLQLKFYTKCKTCHNIYCYECDQKLHSNTPFHQRSLFSEDRSQILLPTHFVDCDGKLFNQGKH